MSRGYWIAAIALGLIFSVSSGKAQEQEQDKQRNPAQQERPAQTFPIPFPVEIIEDQSSTDARKRSEAESAQREIDDLAAQQGMNIATQAMNEATQRMVGLSETQTWLIGIGTGLLLATLVLTIQANRAAVRAAEAADRTVDVTRDIGEAQVRAYLRGHDVQVTHDIQENSTAGPLPIAIGISISNSGQSPAFDVEACFVISVIYENSTGSWETRVYERQIGFPDIESGGTATREMTFLGECFARDSIVSVHLSIGCFGYDVFRGEISSFRGVVESWEMGASAGVAYDVNKADGIFPSDFIGESGTVEALNKARMKKRNRKK